MVSASFYVCVVMFVIVSAAMLVLILVQKGRGIQSLLGGSSGHSVMGHRTPAAVTWLTAGAFGLFLLLAVALNLLA